MLLLHTTLSSSLISFCALHFLSSPCISQDEDADITTTLPFETIEPDFFNVLVGLLPNDYDISTNVYTWNYDEIYNLLTADQPRLFYDLPTVSIYLLPDVMLEWLGEAHPDVMAHHKLCNFLTPEDQFSYNCTTNATVSLACPEPFVDTERYSIFYEGCNLNCKYWNLLWGMSDNMVERLYIARYVATGLSLPCLIVVFVNQYWDSMNSKEWFCQRPFISQCTMFIIICFANIFCQWLVIPMFGESNVLCQQELNGKKGVSFANPKAEWTPCLVSGLHFYIVTNSLVLYCLAFTVSLWKQFYAPLRSVWAQAGCATICDKLCAAMEDKADAYYRRKQLKIASTTQMKDVASGSGGSGGSLGSPGSSNINNINKRDSSFDAAGADIGTDVDTDLELEVGDDAATRDARDTRDERNGTADGAEYSTMSRSTVKSRTGPISSQMEDIHYKWKRSDCGRTYCGLCCINCVCSPNFKYHFVIFLGNITLCIAILYENIIDAFHPLGICYGGGQDEWTSFWYTVSPLFFSVCALFCFVPAAVYLLCKARHEVASKQARNTLDHLGFRLAFYYFGILFAMAMVVVMAWRNNAIRGPLAEAIEVRIECMLFGGSFEECILADDYQLPEYTFWMLYCAVFSACSSTVVVTMHAKQIQRWIRLCPCLKYVLKFGDNYCGCCDKEKVLTKIADGTYFLRNGEKSQKSKNNSKDSKGKKSKKSSKTNESKSGSSRTGDTLGSNGTRGTSSADMKSKLRSVSSEPQHRIMASTGSDRNLTSNAIDTDPDTSRQDTDISANNTDYESGNEKEIEMTGDVSDGLAGTTLTQDAQDLGGATITQESQDARDARERVGSNETEAAPSGDAEHAADEDFVNSIMNLNTMQSTD